MVRFPYVIICKTKEGRRNTMKALKFLFWLVVSFVCLTFSMGIQVAIPLLILVILGGFGYAIIEFLYMQYKSRNRIM